MQEQRMASGSLSHQPFRKRKSKPHVKSGKVVEQHHLVVNSKNQQNEAHHTLNNSADLN